jgi:serine phosphatase RsbU (regulator of sigma subunit)
MLGTVGGLGGLNPATVIREINTCLEAMYEGLYFNMTYEYYQHKDPPLGPSDVIGFLRN